LLTGGFACIGGHAATDGGSVSDQPYDPKAPEASGLHTAIGSVSPDEYEAAYYLSFITGAGSGDP
jgi:hypothetical protein